MPKRRNSTGTSRTVLLGAAMVSAVIGGACTYAFLASQQKRQLEQQISQQHEEAEAARKASQRHANQAHRAREQAEALVEFVLDDLRASLLPLGRTGLLSDAAEQAVTYFESLPPEQVTPETEFHRAKVLITIGQALSDQGDLATAARRFESGMAILQALVDNAPSNLEWRFELGWSLTEFGIILEKSRDYQRALSVNSKALTLFESLLAIENRDSTEVDWIYGLAASQFGLGAAAAGLGSSDEALAAYEAAVDAATRALELDPEHILSHQVHAIALNDAGLVHLRNQAYAQAISLHKQGVAAMRLLMERDPTTRRWEKELATGLNNIGTSLDALGKHAEAVPYLMEALTLRQGLVAWDSHNGEWMINLANSWHNMAALYYDLQKTSKAQDATVEATRIYHHLLSREPNNAGWHHELERSHHALGNELLKAGQATTAIELYQHLIKEAQEWQQAQPDLFVWEEHLMTLHRHWQKAQQTISPLLPHALLEIRRSAARVRGASLGRHPNSRSARLRLAHALEELATVAGDAGRKDLSLQCLCLAHFFVESHGPMEAISSIARQHAHALASAAGKDSSTLTPLLRAGAPWRYRDGATISDTWAANSFDDGTWKEGRAPLGYGEGDEATVLEFGPDPDAKFITAWFRHTIRRPFPVESLPGTLHLGIVCDDGAVVYLNGHEILRLGMPSGPIRPETLASLTTQGSAEKRAQFYEISTRALELGDHEEICLAVEVHQNEPVSSDLRFDFELHPALAIPQPLEGFDLAQARHPDWLGEVIPEMFWETLSQRTSGTRDAPSRDPQ